MHLEVDRGSGGVAVSRQRSLASAQLRPSIVVCRGVGSGHAAQRNRDQLDIPRKPRAFKAPKRAAARRQPSGTS